MENLKFNNSEASLSQPVTIGLLLQYADEFLIPRFSEMMSEMMDEKLNKGFSQFSKNLDEKLDKRFAAHTNELKQYVETRLGHQNHDLKVYIDDKLADQTSEIFLRIDKKDKPFKRKVVDVFKKNRLATTQEIKYLEQLT